MPDKIPALVDLDALHKAISQSFKDVLAAHDYRVCTRSIEDEYDMWGNALEVASFDPISAEAMTNLIHEIGRNAAQACLAVAVQEAPVSLLEEAIQMAKQDRQHAILEPLVQLRTQLKATR